jgi:hypothetical protein
LNAFLTLFLKVIEKEEKEKKDKNSISYAEHVTMLGDIRKEMMEMSCTP